VVEYDNDVSEKVYSFDEYKHSAQVVKDFPKLIFIMEKILESMHDYKHYTAVWHVIQSVADSKLTLELQYDYYNRVNKLKGRIE
jgi:hypothetical protein